MLAGEVRARGGDLDRVRQHCNSSNPPFYNSLRSFAGPLVYLIHNLLTSETLDESQYLMDLSDSAGFTKSGSPNWLEGYEGTTNAKEVTDGPGRVTLWKGGVDNVLKGIEERIMQVTGFPTEHMGEWGFSKYEEGELKRPGYDGMKGTYHEQSASILVFLNDVEEGGEIYFPAGDNPVKIKPKKGMAVVWHNSGSDGALDKDCVYGEMRVKEGVKYTVKKWVGGTGKGVVRANVLPVLFIANKGKR